MNEMPEAVKRFTTYLRVTKNRSAKTVAEYEHDLLTFFRYMAATDAGIPYDSEEFLNVDLRGIDYAYLDKISQEDILNYLGYAALDRKNEAATRARKLSSLKTFFKYLHLTIHAIDENPAINIDSPVQKKRLPKYLTLQESLDLLAAVRGDTENKYRERDLCIITLFLNCGMRLSELTGISLSDIDPDLRSMRVIGKGNKERIIYLNDACRETIKQYIAVRGRDGEIKDKNALFISREHRRISNQMVQKIVYKYLDAAGLGYKHFSTHKLRHTAATLMYQQGHVDVRVLKDILGHEQLNTTQIYTHVSDEAMEDAMNRNPLSSVKPTGKKEE
ncbi:MAG: tyrosine recombinase XerC [Clostridia bacterium]|nr:tyrosine recombinase XerC [Clostridia bacterium]